MSSKKTLSAFFANIVSFNFSLVSTRNFFWVSIEKPFDPDWHCNSVSQGGRAANPVTLKKGGVHPPHFGFRPHTPFPYTLFYSPIECNCRLWGPRWTGESRVADAACLGILSVISNVASVMWVKHGVREIRNKYESCVVRRPLAFYLFVNRESDSDRESDGAARCSHFQSFLDNQIHIFRLI